MPKLYVKKPKKVKGKQKVNTAPVKPTIKISEDSKIIIEGKNSEEISEEIIMKYKKLMEMQDNIEETQKVNIQEFHTKARNIYHDKNDDISLDKYILQNYINTKDKNISIPEKPNNDILLESENISISTTCYANNKCNSNIDIMICSDSNISNKDDKFPNKVNMINADHICTKTEELCADNKNEDELSTYEKPNNIPAHIEVIPENIVENAKKHFSSEDKNKIEFTKKNEIKKAESNLPEIFKKDDDIEDKLQLMSLTERLQSKLPSKRKVDIKPVDNTESVKRIMQLAATYNDSNITSFSNENVLHCRVNKIDMTKKCQPTIFTPTQYETSDSSLNNIELSSYEFSDMSFESYDCNSKSRSSLTKPVRKKPIKKKRKNIFKKILEWLFCEF
ncbi:hypothetical protein TCON_0673 [Astathelohania contejeani]|uniref:Uncharacterized protein n=1 Tax=Astathelohania contejeani TaxID=164912 RepID=A0ABQ7I0Z7_9MICR|nr:hypothetical protein TCON_0673 [Thelohania contejeani]